MNEKQLPVAIIGGGPVGLAAAAHLVTRNLPFILFEAGRSISANVDSWAHVRMFSPWRYNIDKAASALLSATGWNSPDPEQLPTGRELIDKYLHPLAEHPAIRPFVHTATKVVSVGRKGMDKLKSAGREQAPFIIITESNGERKEFEASAVIDASGAWQNHNPLGSGGLVAAGEIESGEAVYYGIPDVHGIHRSRYSGKNVLVVGGGHSAINTILALEQLKRESPATQIHWVLRKKSVEDAFGGQENDGLPARGELGTRMRELVEADRISVYTPFAIHAIERENGKLTVTGVQHGTYYALRGIDEIVANTGVRPDMSLLREVRAEFDAAVESVPALAELIDPNIHSCGTVRPHGERELRQKEKDLYVTGMKSYGRAPTFLMATGYEQVRSVVAALAGDWEAARDVQLDLPETGVCSTGGGDGCCTPAPATKKAAACC